MRIPFIPLYIALTALFFSPVATAAEMVPTGASLKDVSAKKDITGDELSNSESQIPSTRCMINPRGEGCSKGLSGQDLSTAVDIAIATGQAAEVVSPIADMNAAIAMQEAYAARGLATVG